MGTPCVNVRFRRIETELKSLEQSMGEELMVWHPGVDGLKGLTFYSLEV